MTQSLNRAWLIMGFALALCGGVARAQAAGAPPKPGPEHQKLGYFVGKWKVEGEMKPNPFMPGGKMTSQDRCEWFEGRFSVICHYEGTAPTGPTKGVGIFGYSSEEQAYTYYGLDNSPMCMTSVPLGKVTGTQWIYHDESKMGGKTIQSRYTIDAAAPASYTFKWEVLGEDGSWQAISEGKATKQP